MKRGDGRFIRFGAPRIGPGDIRAVVATLRSGWIGPGPRAAEFEARFARHLGTRDAVAVSSGTAALHLALVAGGIRAGDEVVTSPLTFAATANAILAAGGVPRFADVNRVTQNLDPVAAARAVTRRTRAILPVHIAGRPCDMRAIKGLARRRGLVVVEDAAHAIEALDGGRHAGTIGDFGCFSFTYSKNVTAGEGGVVVARRASAGRIVRRMSGQGLSEGGWARFRARGLIPPRVIMPGFKYTMADLNAAIVLGQFRHLGKWWRRRRAIWSRYAEQLRDLPVTLPSEDIPGGRHALHLYTVHLDLERLRLSRDEIRAALARRGIGTGVHFVSLHLHPWYRRRFGFAPGDFPNARWISERTISLPLTPHLNDDQVDRVVRVFRDVVGRAMIRSGRGRG